MPHHVIEKEDGHHAPHCHRHHRIHIDVVGEDPDPEREQREDREPGAKPVDAVDQVVRIGQQNDHQHRQQRAHSRRHMVQPEQAVEVVDPDARAEQQCRAEQLGEELDAVTHPGQVVGQPHAEEHGRSGNQEHEFARNRHLMRGRHVQAEHIPQAYREGEREKECRQERHAAQPGNRAGVRFAGTELVEQFFLFRDHHDAGNSEPSRSGGQQKSGDDK